MTTYTSFGYLETDYLYYPYMSGQTQAHVYEQIDQKIFSSKTAREQIQRQVFTTKTTNEQITRRIEFLKNLRSQINQKIFSSKTVRSQVSRNVTGTTKKTREQIKRQVVGFPHPVSSQIKLATSALKSKHEQINRKVTGTLKSMRSQVHRGVTTLESCQGYLEQSYLTTAYLAYGYCAHIHSQIELRQGFSLRSQIKFVLYNTSNLRIMMDFPSRGTSGLNWTSTSTEPGDFSPFNLNTDIVEQVWRSVDGITSVNLTCDTEVTQGVFIDTLAMLGHNLTTSATIVLQGADNPSFAPSGFTTTVPVTLEDAYYIAPTAPNNSFRYWRLIITDTTNPDGYIKVGTIVFGTAIIFQSECFVDEVVKSARHFADKVPTEGFTNVSNDRALKHAVQLEFKLLKYDRNNYSRISDVFTTARTSLKCLWIPTPTIPTRFGIFGKLSQIPVETHKVFNLNSATDYISFNVEVDESL